MSEQSASALGWKHLRAARWNDASSCFERALEPGDKADAWEGLSWSRWWVGDAQSLFDARRNAYQAFRRDGDAAGAARMAIWLGADEFDFNGSASVASGWFTRAERLLAPLADTAEHGWLRFHKGYLAISQGAVEDAELHGQDAARYGQVFGVADLEMLGLALQGMSLALRGQVEDGMRHLEEAAAMALCEDASIPISPAWTFCFLVTACTRLFDMDRAQQWCERIAEFAYRYDSDYMLGFCQAEFASIHVWRGEWERAEGALHDSSEAYARSRPAMVSGPRRLLADLRIAQRRFHDAAELLEDLDASTKTQWCRARLALAQGNALEAASLCERALRTLPDSLPLIRLEGLELRIHALITSGNTAEATEPMAEFERIVAVARTVSLRAKAQLIRGRVELAQGDLDKARRSLEDAVDGFERCSAPLFSSTTRLELASALSRAGYDKDADREVALAQATLTRLGVSHVPAFAAQSTPPTSLRSKTESDMQPDALSQVSARERDVLLLLAEGLTNRQIAERLFISEHTVHRHVASILRKLDVPTRAAAAALAVRATHPVERPEFGPAR